MFRNDSLPLQTVKGKIIHKIFLSRKILQFFPIYQKRYKSSNWFLYSLANRSQTFQKRLLMIELTKSHIINRVTNACQMQYYRLQTGK